MDQFMEKVRLDRCTRELAHRRSALLLRLKVWRQAQDPAQILPEDEDIIHMPPFSAIIVGGAGPVPTDDIFAEAMAQLRQMCLDWRQEKDNFLLSLMVAAGIPECTQSALALATTSFRCTRCSLHISYPRILKHGCAVSCADKALGSPQERLKCYTSSNKSSFDIQPWNAPGNFVEPAVACARFAGAVIEAAGEDPTKITAHEMDTRNVRWICDGGHIHTYSAESFHSAKEPETPEFKLYMNWRMAVGAVSHASASVG